MSYYSDSSDDSQQSSSSSSVYVPVSKASRSIKKNNLFLAIKGKKMMEINLLRTHLKMGRPA